MYDPNDMEALTSMLKLLPEDIMKAMGFTNVVTDLTGYLASWLYGLLMFGFPMVYCIILGNRLVARMVDNSSFVYLLSTPNSRSKIIITQGIYALVSIIVLFIALFGVGVIFSEVMFSGSLDTRQFLSLNFTTMLVNMVVMMISFFFSCLFNETKLSLTFGAGIPIAFLLMNMLGGASADMEILGINLIYIGIIIFLFVASVLIFKKRRLPL